MAEDSEEDRPDLRMVKDVVTGYTVRWHEHVSPTNHLLNAASFKDPALLRKALAAGADPIFNCLRDACSMAWRCRLLIARRGQHGSVIAECTRRTG